jgi:UDP-GlcNAc:undecaprenyl-phosphate/decaprenyl-phosphate GlcNAc-1-phosphate transferase
METQILGFLTSFFVVLLATPSLIKVAKLKHLVDEPGDARKLHKRSTPTIGGIIIYSAFLFAYALWFPDYGDNLGLAVKDFKYLIAILVILFFVGVKDDIIGTAPMKKLSAHIVVGFILIMMAEVKIFSMHGLFNLWDNLPEWASVLMTLFVYVVVVNAYNLVDGVDGLAAGLGFIACMAFGTWFYASGDMPHALLAFIMGGALLGFLLFNFMPARIFMGDSGSLIIGAVVSLLAIRMIECSTHRLPAELVYVSKPVLAMAILAYPLVDTLRVFAVRIYRGQSPFSADRNHLHHHLLGFGLNHAKTVLIIYAYSLVVIATAMLTGRLGITESFCITLFIALILPACIFIFRKKKKE